MAGSPEAEVLPRAFGGPQCQRDKPGAHRPQSSQDVMQGCEYTLSDSTLQSNERA